MAARISLSRRGSRSRESSGERRWSRGSPGVRTKMYPTSTATSAVESQVAHGWKKGRAGAATRSGESGTTSDSRPGMRRQYSTALPRAPLERHGGYAAEMAHERHPLILADTDRLEGLQRELSPLGRVGAVPLP